MIDIIISLSLYIFGAILLGFIFGWFIARAVLKDKFKKQVEALRIDDNLNKDTQKIDSKVKDQEISELKDEIRRLKSEHEKEVDAFLEERIDITMKYKELLDEIAA